MNYYFSFISFFRRLGPTQNYRRLTFFFVVSDYEPFVRATAEKKKSFHEIANLEVIKKETFVNCH